MFPLLNYSNGEEQEYKRIAAAINAALKVNPEWREEWVRLLQAKKLSFFLMGGRVMRNFVIGCIVLFAMAGTACNKEPKLSDSGVDATALPAVKLDLSTPQAAVISHFEAEEAGNAAQAKRAAIIDDAISDLIDASVAAKRARHIFVEVATQRFGKDATKQMHISVPSILIEVVKTSKVTVTGDKAEIGTHGDYPCRRIGGEWKYDLVSLYRNRPAIGVDYDRKVAALDDQFAKDIVQGKWASFAEMMKAHDSQMPKPPPPPKSNAK